MVQSRGVPDGPPPPRANALPSNAMDIDSPSPVPAPSASAPSAPQPSAPSPVASNGRGEAGSGAGPAEKAPTEPAPDPRGPPGEQTPAISASGAPPLPAGAGGGDPPAAAALADTFSNRESRHVRQEALGEVTASYVTNDGSSESARLLLGAKDIFARCLPNMPKPYIVRLVFDRRHRSAVLWRRGGVIGGITYRPFYPAQEGAPVFAEIAFCAVSQSLQVSGFGTRVMNWAKHFALERDGCTHFLTYADNNAVGYFAKQGFSKSIALDREVWQGYIKDYDGGTLMECAIHPRLPHVRLPAMLLRQKEAVESQVRIYSRGHVVHPGLHSWRDGARVAATPESVPGLLDAGWRAEDAARERRDFQLVVRGALVDASADNRQRYMRDLLTRLQREPDAWPFLKPVPVEEVPDYYDVIKDPIDLSLIEARLESRAFYVTLEIFAADVARVFANAQVYNAADTFFHKIAIKLYDEFQDWLSSGIVYTS